MSARARARQFANSPKFPLRVSPGRRYLVTPGGVPFVLIGDGLWNIWTQCSSLSQITTVLQNRAAKGYTAILVEAFEHEYSDQTPRWNNAISGATPFTTTANSASMTWTSRTEAFWTVVDHTVNIAAGLGMAVVINPAYWGYGNGTDGWATAIGAASDADLQNYGAWLANRFKQGNVIWCVGGDDALDGGIEDTTNNTPNRTKQWQIIVGIRSVNTEAIITGHPARAGSSAPNTDGDSWRAWQYYTGFNFPSIYAKSDATDPYSLAATAYARNRIFFAIEGPYEEGGSSDNLRKYAWQAMLSGACGVFGGQFPRWGLGAANITGGSGVANCVANEMNTSGDAEMGIVSTFCRAYPQHTLVPKTDASLVSSSLSTGATRVCPALASDGSFAAIYVPTSQTVTVVMTGFTKSSMRIRLLNTTTGAYTTVGTFANSGTQDVATGGERVIVVD